jgi:hypothetical protein
MQRCLIEIPNIPLLLAMPCECGSLALRSRSFGSGRARRAEEQSAAALKVKSLAPKHVLRARTCEGKVSE